MNVIRQEIRTGLFVVVSLAILFVVGRYLTEETDEYLRLMMTRQALIASAFTLSIATVWGFLENFELVPHVPMYWAFIIWCAGLGVGTLANELRG